MDEEERYWLVASLETIENLAALAGRKENEEELPTLLEYLAEEAQKLVFKHCVVKEEKR